MAIALVQNAALGSTGNAATQQTSAFGAQPTVGNYLVGWAWGWRSSIVVSVVFSDTAGNTWAIPAGGFQPVGSDLWVAIAYAKITATGASFKVTAGPGSGTSSIMVAAAEFSGVLSASPLDGSAVGTTGTTGVPAPGSLTEGSSGDVVCAVFSSDQTTYTTFGYGTPTGFTRAAFQNDGNTFQVGEAVYAIGPTSPTNPSWKTGTVKWGSAQFALKAAAVAGATAYPAALLIGSF